MAGNAVIMGAGPAGLAAGFVLAEADNPWQVTVLEKDAQPGGLAKTLSYKDFRFDIGGHRWFTKNDQLNQFLKDLLGDELRLTPRISRIYFEGKYYFYPIRISNALLTMGPLKAVSAVTDFLLVRIKSALLNKPVLTMEDAYINQFGKTLYRMFFQGYSEKVWGKSCDRISADWVAQRVKGMSILTTIKNAIFKDKKVASLIDEFMYPKKGIGRISEKMAETIGKLGSKVILQQKVVKIKTSEDLVTSIIVANEKGENYEITGEQFISSIPITELLQILEPCPPAEVLEKAEKLGYRDLITVHLLLNRPQVTPDTWVYIHDRSLLMGRLHEPKNWSPEMVPDPQKTSLVVEYFCNQGGGDEIWQKSNDELIEITVSDLTEKLGFIKKAEVLDALVQRNLKAYPVYHLGYQQDLTLIKDYLAKFKNLQLIGRNGIFRYNNMDHSIETGLLAAQNLLGEKTEIEKVNIKPEYHEIKYIK